MRIGDIEYTRTVIHTNLAAANASEVEIINFAVGIKVRALLTRIQVTNRIQGVATGGTTVSFENGDSVGAGLTEVQMYSDLRLFPVYQNRNQLSTNGMVNFWGPRETTWWKLLFPTVRLHFVDSVITGTQWKCVLHYRFATLTDDEITEIAAQRSQE